jgi:hypothetical protein
MMVGFLHEFARSARRGPDLLVKAGRCVLDGAQHSSPPESDA